MSNEVVEPKSKALGSNPKDLLGAKKVDFAKVPPVAIAWEALAMMDGGGKYGPFNWRGNKVVASIYVAAAMRHLLQWYEGERCAEDSGCHHLGHARACMGILLDAEATGNLIDDRPVNESSIGALAKVFAEIESKIPAMNERHKKFHEAKAAKAVFVVSETKTNCSQVTETITIEEARLRGFKVPNHVGEIVQVHAHEPIHPLQETIS